MGQPERDLRRSAWIYTTDLHPRVEARARGGGARGEILARKSLTRSLARTGTPIRELKTLRQFACLKFSMALIQKPSIFFLDRWTLDLALRYRLLSGGDLARTWILDWFGTPTALAHSRVPATRHLTPFPSHPNRFLGFILHEATAPFPDAAMLREHVGKTWATRPKQVVLWGKEPKYFDERARTLIADLVRSGARVVTTVDHRHGFDEALQSLGATNLGHLDPTLFRALLAKSAVLVGLGDPLLGPTPLEALAEGCAYVNPVFQSPRVIEQGRMIASSQQPYLESLPEPLVFGALPGPPIDVVRRALDLRGSLSSLNASLSDRLVFALDPYTEAAHRDRLADVIAE